MTTPNNPTKYTGTNQYLVSFVTRNRAPTSADFRQPETGKNYPIGIVWQVGKNPTTGSEGDLWMLSKIVANQSTWVELSSSTGPVLSFTTNIGGPVLPTAGGAILENASVTTFTDGSVANTLKTELQGTNHAMFVGRGANVAATNIAVGADHSICMGNTGADPAFTTTGTPYVAGISFDTGTNTLIRYKDVTTFTPTVFGATSAGVGTYTEQTGRYTIIGNVLYFTINFLWTAHTGTGDMMIGGFPNAFANALSFYPCVCMIQNIPLPANTLWVVVDGVNNTTTAEVTASLDNAAFSPVQMDGAGSLHVSGFYQIAP